jgi:hypothetical protein
MAILTTVLLGAIVAIQVIEFQLYRAEPTVWAAPRP